MGSVVVNSALTGKPEPPKENGEVKELTSLVQAASTSITPPGSARHDFSGLILKVGRFSICIGLNVDAKRKIRDV